MLSFILIFRILVGPIVHKFLSISFFDEVLEAFDQSQQYDCADFGNFML